jgi:hypothetical protein
MVARHAPAPGLHMKNLHSSYAARPLPASHDLLMGLKAAVLSAVVNSKYDKNGYWTMYPKIAC